MSADLVTRHEFEGLEGEVESVQKTMAEISISLADIPHIKSDVSDLKKMIRNLDSSLRGGNGRGLHTEVALLWQKVEDMSTPPDGAADVLAEELKHRREHSTKWFEKLLDSKVLSLVLAIFATAISSLTGFRLFLFPPG